MKICLVNSSTANNIIHNLLHIKSFFIFAGFFNKKPKNMTTKKTVLNDERGVSRRFNSSKILFFFRQFFLLLFFTLMLA